MLRKVCGRPEPVGTGVVKGIGVLLPDLFQSFLQICIGAVGKIEAGEIADAVGHQQEGEYITLQSISRMNKGGEALLHDLEAVEMSVNEGPTGEQNT